MRALLGILAVAVMGTALNLPAATATAQTLTIEQRRTIQKERIRTAAREGRLSRDEIRRLHEGQRKIASLHRKALRDGQLRTRESARLQRELSRQSRLIRRLGSNSWRYLTY